MVPDQSVDLIISNCVINLSPDKKSVLSEAHRVLADGGEFYFSDVYCDRRLPEAGSDEQCLPRHHKVFTSRNNGIKCGG